MQPDEPRVYEIAAWYTGVFMEKIAELQKKAAKLNCGAINVNMVGTRHIVEKDDITGFTKREYDVNLYTVTGDPPKFAGWTFVAVLEQHPGGVLASTIPGQTLPEYYRTAPPVCDHCHTSRARNFTYVVRNDAGEHKQVGSSCLRDFLGHASPQKIAQYCELLIDMEGSLDDGDERNRGGGQDFWSLEYFLSCVAVNIRLEGWVSRGAARKALDEGDHRVATVERAWDSMLHPHDKDKWGNPLYHAPAEEDLALARKVIKWAREDLATRKELDDYQWNLSVALSGDDLTQRAAGIAASGVSAYRREIEKQVERAKQFANSNWVGKEGERLVFADLECTGMRELESEWGVSIMCRFRDASGNVLVWFSSGFRPEVGHHYQGKGTVKKHEDYKGVKQTQLTRCNFTEKEA